MSPTAIETALDSHEDELSRTAIDIGSLARRIEQLEAMQARLLGLLELVPDIGADDGDDTGATFLKLLTAIKAEMPKRESAESLLTAQIRHPEPKAE